MKKLVALVFALLLAAMPLVSFAEHTTQDVTVTGDGTVATLGADVTMTGGMLDKVVAVEITWKPTAANWEYFGGTWDPEKHDYFNSDTKSIGWVGAAPGYKVTAINHSNCDVTVTCSYNEPEQRDGVEVWDFYQKMPDSAKPAFSSTSMKIFGWNHECTNDHRTWSTDLTFRPLSTTLSTESGVSAPGHEVTMGTWTITVEAN